jgi:hypothetical protein
MADDPRPELAPSWLPRQQRRRVDRQLHKLLRRGTCSICDHPLKHNTRTASGLDANGNAVVAGECCIDRLAEIFALGFYSSRKYDFLQSSDAKSDTQPTNEQILNAIALWQEVIADAEKHFTDVERRGGGIRASEIVLLNHPWKTDDRDWFQHNPTRSHRARMPFPGELSGKFGEMAKLQVAHVRIFNEHAEIQVLMLVRQVAPGSRIRAAITINAGLLPLPDDEAVAHALFEVAARHEAAPPDSEALDALIKKYTTGSTS